MPILQLQAHAVLLTTEDTHKLYVTN